MKDPFIQGHKMAKARVSFFLLVEGVCFDAHCLEHCQVHVGEGGAVYFELEMLALFDA